MRLLTLLLPFLLSAQSDRFGLPPCLGPAADLAADPAAYRDSFLLSTVIPQPPQVNNGVWRRLHHPR